MNAFARIASLLFIWAVTSVAWWILGASADRRATDRAEGQTDDISALWGSAHVQSPPVLSWTEQVAPPPPPVSPDPNTPAAPSAPTTVVHPLVLASTDVQVKLHLDPRRRGLVWYALFDVELTGVWTFRHEGPARTVEAAFPFPNPDGIYDGFRFVVDGQDFSRQIQRGQAVGALTVQPGQVVRVEANYRSRGRDAWQYVPSSRSDVGVLEHFQLTLNTDFTDIDFPLNALSPSEKTATADGLALAWRFERVVTGRGVGLLVPQRIQPGELASALATSAPVALLFFFGVLFLLDLVRRIGMHPFNYAFLAAAFFAFHLLFAYSADRLPVEWAFALASAVSLALVASYLRLVVSARFALREALAIQLVYLVGFSLAHFWKGLTGLTVTLLSIATLFLLMQLTGRIRWAEVLKSGD